MSMLVRDIAIILVTFRQKQNLELLYISLHEQTNRDFRIYFVDNNEGDEDIERSEELNGKFSFDIEYIKSGCNAGFAAGNNLGAAKAISDGFGFILFLNNDNELDKDCINSLVLALKNDDSVGAVSPLILFGGDKRSENIIQEFGEECDFDKYRIIKNFELKRLADVVQQMPDMLKCSLLSGGAVMFKQKVLKKTGLWEERYFAYGDEIDIFKRLKAAGYAALAVKSARLYHRHKWSKENKQSYYFEYYLIERNKFLYFHKFGLYGAMFVMLIAELVKFPWRLRWFMKVCDLKLGIYYLRGIFAGLFNRKGKPELFN